MEQNNGKLVQAQNCREVSLIYPIQSSMSPSWVLSLFPQVYIGRSHVTYLACIFFSFAVFEISNY